MAIEPLFGGRCKFGTTSQRRLPPVSIVLASSQMSGGRSQHGARFNMLKALLKRLACGQGLVIVASGLLAVVVAALLLSPKRKPIVPRDTASKVAVVPSVDSKKCPAFDESVFLEDAYAALEPGESVPAHELRLRVARLSENESTLALETSRMCAMLARDARFAIGPRRYIGLAGLPPRRNPFDFEFDPTINEMDDAS